MSSQARESKKSGLVLYYEAMEKFDPYKDLEESFKRFERAAAKGHEESIWICGVAKGEEMDDIDGLKEAFAKTETPLGYYFAGRCSFYFGRQAGMERFEFQKKSAEGGCSWGQVEYAEVLLEENQEQSQVWVENAASQNNPRALHFLGCSTDRDSVDREKAAGYFRAAVELGFQWSWYILGKRLREGKECSKDLRQAAIWGAKAPDYIRHRLFWEILKEVRDASEEGAMEKLDGDFNQLCYALGWGLFWYKYGGKHWERQGDKDKAFGDRCLDYYCSCVDLQQKSIFTFLLCWIRTVGMKDVGSLIGQMVWEGREDNLVKCFDR
jgi:TPR repeat protein